MGQGFSLRQAALRGGESGEGGNHIKEYLRRQEAAEVIHVSLGTLDSYIRKGLLAVIRPSPGVVLIRRSDLDQALDRFRIGAVGENNGKGI